MDKVTVKKQQIIALITQYLVENGLSDVGIRKLAAIAGTSDRMLIYYFGTKDGLIGAVLNAIAAGLTTQLDTILGQHQRPAATLLSELLTLGDLPEFKVIVQLWFEVVGLAARGQEPYAENATAIGNNWLGWVESRLIPEEVDQAMAVFAELEGRLMIKMIGIDQ